MLKYYLCARQKSQNILLVTISEKEKQQKMGTATSKIYSCSSLKESPINQIMFMLLNAIGNIFVIPALILN